MKVEVHLHNWRMRCRDQWLKNLGRGDGDLRPLSLQYKSEGIDNPYLEIFVRK
jgi:hypothetical protein